MFWGGIKQAAQPGNQSSPPNSCSYFLSTHICRSNLGRLGSRIVVQAHGHREWISCDWKLTICVRPPSTFCRGIMNPAIFAGIVAVSCLRPLMSPGARPTVAHTEWEGQPARLSSLIPVATLTIQGYQQFIHVPVSLFHGMIGVRSPSQREMRSSAGASAVQNCPQEGESN